MTRVKRVTGIKFLVKISKHTLGQELIYRTAIKIICNASENLGVNNFNQKNPDMVDKPPPTMLSSDSLLPCNWFKPTM